MMFIEKIMRFLGVCFLLNVAFIACNVQEKKQLQLQSTPSEPYAWKSVQIVGGGFVDGIVCHPNAKDVRYCRTDMGGAYRWSKDEQRWISMLDWVSYDDHNLIGVESIAVDPNDPRTVYLSCGTYTSAQTPNGAIMISNDGGVSFRRVDMPFKMGGNENGRGHGERMMVDPANSNIIYLGTRLNGLWRSVDKGNSWQRVTTFPDVTEVPDLDSNVPAFMRSQGCGIVFVVFDPNTAVKGKGCTNIYVGVSLMGRDNMFVSADGGANWKAIPGQPTQYRPTQGTMDGNGHLYITYGTNPGPSRMQDGGVWKYAIQTGAWTEVSPVKPDPANRSTFGYASVSVDPNNPNHLIVSTFNRPVPNRYTEDDLFRSTDGGATWKSVFAGNIRLDYSKAPYTEFTPIHWIFDVEIDPFDSNHALFTTGYGGWETFNLNDTGTDKDVVWQIMSTGVEETVPMEFYSPIKGAHLISAVLDYGGFTHVDLDKAAGAVYHTKPYFFSTNSLNGAANQPDIVVRVGSISAHQPGGRPIAYSLDGGITWNNPDSIPPQARSGYIAVSSDGVTWVWAPERIPVHYTNDRGKTWQPSEGIPANIRGVTADQVNPKRFYAIDITAGTLYRSIDGGISFTSESILRPIAQPGTVGVSTYTNRGDRRGGQDRVYATPGYEGDLWIPAWDGLYHIEPGKEIVQLDKVRQIYGFGFGKAKPGSNYPAMYLAGIINGVHGFYRSDDAAVSWVRINDDNRQVGLVLHLTGDPKVYGRVYMGAHGRGVSYGDPIK